MQRKGNHFALLVGMQTGAATVESSMEIPQKLEMDLPFDPAIPLLGIFPKKSKANLKECKPPLCSLQHYLQSPRYGSSPGVHQEMSG